MGSTSVELLILLAIPVLLAWSVIYLRFSGILGCAVACLVAGTVLGHPFFHISVVTLDRLILAACVGLFVGYQFRGWNQPRVWAPADWLFVVFLVAIVLTTFIQPSSEGRVGPASKLIFFFLLPAAFYVLGGQVTLTPKQLRIMFATLAVLGVYLALTAVAEKLNWTWAVFPKYIMDPKFSEFLGRGRGPLLNPAANGIVLILALSCGIMPVLWGHSLRRLSVLAIVPVYLIGIYCTLTRSVWLACGMVLFGIVVALVPNRWRLALAMIVLGCSSITFLVDVKSLLTFKRDRNVTVEQMSESANLRPILAMVAWRMFQDRPLFGCGTGQYLEHAKNYLFDRSTDLPLEKVRPYVQHNMFLATLVENGLVTLIPFCFLLLCWSLWSWRLWNSRQLEIEYRQLGLVSLSLLTAYIINGLFHDVLIFPMINAYMFFIAGAVRNCTVHLQSRLCKHPSQYSPAQAPTTLSHTTAHSF
jgi:O-Antigen ligase